MADLKRFSPTEIVLSNHEAWVVLKFFWPDCRLAESDLAPEDVGFAQGLLLEAIDASYAMGYVDIIFNTFYGKVPGSFVDVKNLIKDFAKEAGKHWFKHLGTKSLDNAEIYEMVRRALARNFRSVLVMRQEGGGLIY